MAGDPAFSPTASDTALPIDEPYLLVTQIPTYVDASGRLWHDRLWHTDLARHLAYLRHLVLAAPVSPKPDSGADSGDLVRLEPPAGSSLSLARLPRMSSRTQAALHLPAAIAAIWRAAGSAAIVHASMGGWPYPLAFVAIPLARLRRRRSLVVVESAPWRLAGDSGNPLRRLHTRLTEAAVRFMVSLADLAIFTNAGYRASLMPVGSPRGHVIPASWIGEDDVLPLEKAEAAWRDKIARNPSATRFLFAGRLTSEKGIEVLLDAARRLDDNGVQLQLEVIGEGPLLERCRLASARSRSAQLRVHPVIPYGNEFFALVRGCDALVVPSLTDEQPRIVFDAFSQAVPVIASDTPGLRDLVEEGVTGWRFPPGDEAALATLLQRAIADREALRAMGLRAREQARRMTHAHMHAERSRLIRAMLG